MSLYLLEFMEEDIQTQLRETANQDIQTDDDSDSLPSLWASPTTQELPSPQGTDSIAVRDPNAEMVHNAEETTTITQTRLINPMLTNMLNPMHQNNQVHWIFVRRGTPHCRFLFGIHTYSNE